TALEVLDFDQDGDIDIALVSSFPDYQNNPDLSFVFLENKNELNFEFSVNTFTDSHIGRWFLMDTGDIDNDGDEDIILSSFTYIFTPVPESFSKQWNEENVDIMVLKNKLN
ncbi:FG-GAP repeat domain-containing protein, partial [Eudoraea sp.]|uniref:FG-GAP repeat domain-containing protein n=1 Tax=Eudoraea sp. TaxID=1979955 RepID=UPI003C76ABD8